MIAGKSLKQYRLLLGDRVSQHHSLLQFAPANHVKGKRQLMVVVGLVYVILLQVFYGLLFFLPLEEVISPIEFYWVEATDLRIVPQMATIALVGLLFMFWNKVATSTWWSPDRLAWWLTLLYLGQAIGCACAVGILNKSSEPVEQLNTVLYISQLVLVTAWSSGLAEEGSGLLVHHIRRRLFPLSESSDGR